MTLPADGPSHDGFQHGPHDGSEDGTGSGVVDQASPVPLRAPDAPSAATVVFGDRLPLAERFAAILADTGVSHGLIGPREVPILWERHILNCAVAQDSFPEQAEVVDVGSGAGLPGLALAIARPDLHLHLVEPMLRRTTWLGDTIEALGLDNCTVHRGRAEEFHGVLSVPWATARAVARIDKLARWTFPLLSEGGTLVALKGSSAQEELDAAAPLLRRLGMTGAEVRSHGAALLEVPTITLEISVGAGVPRRRKQGKPSRRSGRRS